MNNQNHNKFPFHIHHEEELLQSGLHKYRGTCGAVLFEKGILVEIHGSNKEQYQKNTSVTIIVKRKIIKVYLNVKRNKKKEQKTNLRFYKGSFYVI